jgi:predicted nucleic acid-binding protein
LSAPLLLDASVWLAVLDPDDDNHEAAAKLVQAAAVGTVTLAALDLTLYEVANVAVVRWRSQLDAERLVDLVRLACTETLERAEDELLRLASALAAEHGLTVYDAAYVAAAKRRTWTLVSCDFADLVTPGLAIPPKVAAQG